MLKFFQLNLHLLLCAVGLSQVYSTVKFSLKYSNSEEDEDAKSEEDEDEERDEDVDGGDEDSEE